MGVTKRKVVENYICPIILLLYAMVGANQGADITDTTYSLGNYLFFDSLEGSWKYATFLANALGSVFLGMTGGSFLWMNVLTRLLVGLIAVAVYYFLKKDISAICVFVGEIIALSLCWCPTVILYNYLTYLFLTLAVLFLLKAVREDKKRYYIIAGILLGCNVLVRISNAVEVALIVVVCYGSYQKYKSLREKEEKQENRKELTFWKRVGLCVSGFLLGLIVALSVMLIASGSEGFLGMLRWVFSMFTSSEEAGGYSMTAMFGTILENYLGNMKWFFMMAGGCAAGVFAFSLWKDKFLLIKKIGYTLCVILLFVYFFRNGVFTARYYNVGSIYCLSVLFLLMGLSLFVYVLFRKEYGEKDKVLSLTGLILILITPIGSNNHLYTCINNMFLTAPLTLYFGYGLLKKYKEEKNCFPAKIMAGSFLVVFMMQSVLFHFCFVFHDGTEGEKRTAELQEASFMEGMRTNPAHAAALDELTRFMNQEESGELILYGNIPGVSYLLNRETAVSTSWPDLESYPFSEWEAELASVSVAERPYVIVTPEVRDIMESLPKQLDSELAATENEDVKITALKNYLWCNAYEIIFENNEFVIYQMKVGG